MSKSSQDGLKQGSLFSKIQEVLRLLVNAERVKEEEYDTPLQQFVMFLERIPVFGSERFANFQSAEDGVDTLFFECMANESYKSPFSVVKLILILSHGQATVERGFSVNKEVEVENLKEHTLVAQRIVCDHVNSVGGVLKVALCTQAHSLGHGRGWDGTNALPHQCPAWYAHRFVCRRKASAVGGIPSMSLPFRVKRSLRASFTSLQVLERSYMMIM